MLPMRLLFAATAIASLAGCELFIEIDEDDPVPDRADAGIDLPDLDAGSALLCASDPFYEDLGVPGKLYRTLGGFSWFAGRTRCRADEAEIVSINTLSELTAIVTLVSALPVHANCPTAEPCAWVGLGQGSAGDPAAGWVWADGTTDDGSNWLTGQPDDLDNVESGDEDCAMVASIDLLDEPCQTEVFTVCECDIATQ